MAIIAAWGNVLVCEVSGSKILTPEDIRVSGSARYATHDIIGAKPLREFVGPGLASCSLRVVVSAIRGMAPRVQLDLLRTARDAGEVHALLIGGRSVFQYPSLAVLESIDEAWEFFTPQGGVIQATGTLTFGEYIPPTVPAAGTTGAVTKRNTRRAAR